MDIPSGVKIDLSGKVAFVSGASKGIGVSIAGFLQAAGLCHPPSYVGRQLFFGSSHRIIQGFHFCGYREELDAYDLVRRLRVNQCLEVPNEDQRLVVPVGHFVGGRRLRENLDHLRGDGG